MRVKVRWGLRTVLVAGFILFVFSTSFSCAQAPQSGAKDLDRVDQFLFKKIKTETGKDDSSIYMELGLSYFKQENFNRSFLYFGKATTLNPKAYWAWYYMGLLTMENPEGYFKKAIEANPRFAPPYYWLGRYYCKKKNIKESIKSFRNYMKRAQNDPEEGPRIQSAVQFVELMEAGETSYEEILRKVSF
jgi:tetratricopeptide (TPR) repeat protein